MLLIFFLVIVTFYLTIGNLCLSCDYITFILLIVTTSYNCDYFLYLFIYLVS